MRNVECKEYLKYTFTEAEQREHAMKLARANRELAQLELRKKEVVSALKAQAETQNAEISRLSEFINNGYEYRDVECFISYNVPEAGLKTIIRRDTGDVVRELKMDDFDKQEEFPLDNPNPPNGHAIA